MVSDAAGGRRGPGSIQKLLQLLERHDFADAFESTLLDLPGLVHGEAKRSGRVGQAAGVAIDEPHPQLHDPPFDLRQSPQHPLEGARELGDAVRLCSAGPAAARPAMALPGGVATAGASGPPTSATLGAT